MSEARRSSSTVALLVGGGLDACTAPGAASLLVQAGYRVLAVLSDEGAKLIRSEALQLAGAEIVAAKDVPTGTPALLCPADAAAWGLLGEIATPGPHAGLGGGVAGCLGWKSPYDAVIAARWLVAEKPLAGRTVLITAGPTAEDLDPVRFLTNRSSGRMGVSLATAAGCLGAQTVLVHGPLSVRVPYLPNLETVPVRSASDMHKATMERSAQCDAAILCAAVADFTPAEKATQKLKKTGQDELRLALVRTPDILASLGALAKRPFLVGFAAETQDLDRYAQEKLTRKNCDMICANDVSAADSGFGVETNRITIHRRGQAPLALPLLSKDEAAERILFLVAEALGR
jgi:phosphopantothenoylcysteine synthetase/decarboxylase